jgi:hypothetical protein
VPVTCGITNSPLNLAASALAKGNAPDVVAESLGNIGTSSPIAFT